MRDMDKTNFTIAFGKEKANIRRQLNAQGFDLNMLVAEISDLQACADMLVFLNDHSVLRTRDLAVARGRILRKIKNHLCKLKRTQVVGL